jgi:hypothetical protein
MDRVGCYEIWREDELDVSEFGSGPASRIHHRTRKRAPAAGQHCLGVRSRLTVDPDRHARSGQELDTICSRARRGLVGGQPHINPAYRGPNQRFDDAGAGLARTGLRHIFLC